jgi:putative cell wall-binding protein
MGQKKYRIRRAVVAAVGATTVLSGIGVIGTGTAQAAGPNTTVVAAAPAATLHASTPNQPASNETITIQPTFTWVSGDTITLTVTDSAGTHPVAFSGTPTATPANVTGSALPTVTSAAAGNVLTITFTNSGVTSLAQPILVTGISYSTVVADISGAVTVTPAYTGAGTAGASISPASAATSNATIVGTPTIGLTAASTLGVGAGLNNQSAGSESFGFATASTGWFAGDQLTVRVAPKTGGNCGGTLAAPIEIGFSSAPTVSASTTTGQTAPTFSTVGLTQTAACVGTPFFDQAIVTLTNSGTITGTGAIGPTTQPVTITFSGIAYNITAAVPVGNVSVTGLYNGAAVVGPSIVGAPAGPSNATVGTLSVTANNPPVGLGASTTNQPISNIVLTEAQPGAVPTGFVCVIVSAGSFNTTTAPTVTASGGGAVVSAPTVNSAGTTLQFTVNTASSTAAATYTVSNLNVNTPTSGGPVTAIVSDGGTTGNCGTVVTTGLLLYNTFGVARIFGQTADGTAAAELAAAFPSGCPASKNVVLATDQNFPDALSASYLASKLGTGVLLTPTAALASETVTALRIGGINHVYVVGGPLAVAPNVVAALQQEPVYTCGGITPVTNPTTGAPVLETVTQVFGQTQYDTAQTVAQYFGATAGTGSFNSAYPTSTTGTSAYNTTSGLSGTLAPAAPGTATAILATGQTFPDAMSASAMSYAGQWPILLTQQASLSPQASAAITNLGIRQVIVMGGPIAVSDTVVTQLEALGVSVIRIAGTDYTNTAQLLAQFELSTTNGLGWAVGHTYNIAVARGDFFADALAGSALTGLNHAPIVLTLNPNTLGSGIPGLFTAEHALSPPNQVSNIVVLGGPIAVTPATVNALLASIPS